MKPIANVETNQTLISLKTCIDRLTHGHHSQNNYFKYDSSYINYDFWRRLRTFQLTIVIGRTKYR